MTQDPDESGRAADEHPPPPPPWQTAPDAQGEPQEYPPPPPPYGGQAPQYGQQPPPYGQQPPHYGQQPPQPPHYGQQPPQPPHYGQQPPQPPHYGQQPPQPPHYGQQPPQPPQYGQQPPYGQQQYGRHPPQYGQPPQYGTPPPPGPHSYGGPGPNPGPPLQPQEEKQWATVAHIGNILVLPIVPGVIYGVYKDRGPYVNDQSKEALNFGITAFIAYIAAIIAGNILDALLWSPPLSLIVWVAVVVFAALAAVATNRGENYRYPFSLRLIS